MLDGLMLMALALGEARPRALPPEPPEPEPIPLLAVHRKAGCWVCRTKNFRVEAPTRRLAERMAQWAEHHRRTIARRWLGKEMPAWGEPCPLKVTVTNNGSGGATTFEFDNGSVRRITMEIEGTVERLIASVLPHEVTHTVLAYHFRRPVPRWADEGGSVLSEDDQERRRHDRLVRQVLNTPGRMIPLRRLFALTEYPRDVMVLFAEGYSVTRFLVEAKGRPTFLAFVEDAKSKGWDEAARAHYGHASVEKLEEAWLKDVRGRSNAHKPATTGAGMAASRLARRAFRH
jgi:hypothetical protein